VYSNAIIIFNEGYNFYTMLNNKHIILILVFILILGCKDESILSFNEITFPSEGDTSIEINIPQAKDNDLIANAINSEINHVIINELHIGDRDNITSNSIEESINLFNNEHTNFMLDFPESGQIWEAQIDGEVIFQSEEIISISITSYINTGGAHGNLHITFLNFDALNGKRIPNGNLFHNIEAFKPIAEKYFYENIEDINVLFKPDQFELPVNFGYSLDGFVLLYNVYEIAPYSSGVIDFTIPFEELTDVLVFNSSR
jgi:hypothetical protein